MANSVLRHNPHDIVETIIGHSDDEIPLHNVPDEGWPIRLFPLGRLAQEDAPLAAFAQYVPFRDDPADLFTLASDD